MKKTKVLVVDDNKSLVGMIKEYFKENSNITISLEAYDGTEGIRLIEKKQEEYDIVLLDLIMPNKDGIAVLEYMKKKSIDKKVIVLTSYNTQDMIRKVSELGVSYFILKPFELTELEKRILECSSKNDYDKKTIDMKYNNLQVSITKILHELGVPSHIKGYQYIREGITILYEHPEVIGGITKELYPDIAEKFDTTVSRVERAIRHAIEISWIRGDLKVMEDIFGNSIDFERSKPTNSEFLTTIADRLKLHQKELVG